MTTEASESVSESAPPDGPIVAKAGAWYRMARYAMFVLLVGYGGASIYDGFYSWPKWGITIHTNERPKSDMDILFNRAMGVILPPVGIFILVRMLHKSRGKVRLEDGVVYVPGHPPVPLEKIHAVDRELWDKGIAYVDYDLSDGISVKEGDPGRFKLDDFVYEREPIDQIFAAIEAAILKDAPPAVAPEPEARILEVKPPALAPAPAPKAPEIKAAPKPAAAPAKPVVAPPKPAVAPTKPFAPIAPKAPAPNPGAPKAPPATAPLPRPKFAPSPRTGLPPKFPPPRPPQSGA